MGVDDLTIQAILRHSNVSVTQRCYIINFATDTCKWSAGRSAGRGALRGRYLQSTLKLSMNAVAPFVCIMK
jgi:hypothetical protein